MKAILFWLTIVATCFVPLLNLASDNPHEVTCTRLVNDAEKSTTDPDDTATNCFVISDSYSLSCLETILKSFEKFPTTEESVYDGIDSNHLFACMLFERHSSVTCLNGILAIRRPTIEDMLACSKR